MKSHLNEAAHVISMFCRLSMPKRHNMTISPGEIHVLIFIDKSKAAVTPVMISEFFNVTKPFVTKIIRSLEKNGYIVKKPSESDNRSYHLILTPKAKMLIKEGFSQFLNTITILQTQMGEADFELFIQQIKTANQILSKNK